ncbi:MAG: DUF6588 family protein [bacterium]
MKMKIKIMFLMFILGITLLYSESPEDLIKKTSEEYISGYLTPFVTALGVNMGSGLFHTAKVHGILGFDLGLKGMILLVPEEAKTFEIQVPGLTEKVKVSTILGSSEEKNVDGIIFPGGANISIIPFVIPQASIGVFKGLEVMGRYMTIPIEESNFTVLGIGVKYELSTLIPFCPVNISTQLAYQTLNLADVLKCKTINVNMHVSKNLILFTPYVGIGIDNTKADISYVYKQGTSQAKSASVAIEGENKMRLIIGASFNILFININADYNIGKYPCVSLGSSFSFR